MKEYIHAIIKRDGEEAAGKIAEVMDKYIQYLFRKELFALHWGWSTEETEAYFEEFQDNKLNKK